MNFLKWQIKRQAILEMEVDFDAFIEEKGIKDETIIFRLDFDKSVFKEEKEVREYLEDKGIYGYQIEDAESVFTANLISENQVAIQDIEIEIRRGVKAYAGDLLAVPREDIYFNDKGEIHLANKVGESSTNGLAQIIELACVAEGDHVSYGKLKITKEDLISFRDNFKAKVAGVDLAVNEDHKKNEAFGWIIDVFLSEDEEKLYGQVKWNKKGTQALSEKEYRYFSPEFRFNYVHPHTGKEHGPTLLGGALTNYPFLKMDAITELNNKQEKPTKETAMAKETETTISLSEHNAQIVELNNKLGEVQGRLDAKERENVNLSNKVKELEETQAKREREIANQKLFDNGKINAAQLVALNEGKSAVEVLALGETMNLNEKGSTGKQGGEIQLSEEEKKAAKSLGLTEEDYIAANYK